MKPTPLVSGDYHLGHAAQGDGDSASADVSGAPCLSFKLNKHVLDMVMSTSSSKRRRIGISLAFKAGDGKTTGELVVGDSAANVNIEINRPDTKNKGQNHVSVGSRRKGKKVLNTMGRVVGKAQASATTKSLAKTASKLQETKAMAEEAARDKVARVMPNENGLKLMELKTIKNDNMLETYLAEYRDRHRKHIDRLRKVSRISLKFKTLGKKWEKADSGEAKKEQETKIKDEYDAKIGEYNTNFGELKQLQQHLESLKTRIVSYMNKS